MVAAGGCHSILLKSDGTVTSTVPVGHKGMVDIPVLDEGVTYTQVAAGYLHSLLLKSDGTVASLGRNCDEVGRWDIPPLDKGLTYTQVAAGDFHSLLLKSDGTVAAGGENQYGQCDVPGLDEDLTFTQVAGGGEHSLFLKSDGTVAACGQNRYGQCDFPVLDEGLTFTQVACGKEHSLFLKSDGTVAACGRNWAGECDVPALSVGLTYKQVAAGGHYSLLLKSDGTVESLGRKCDEVGRDIPPLDKGLTYTHVAAGPHHFLLLKSDGTVAACGSNLDGQCDIPSLSVLELILMRRPVLNYVASCQGKRILQLSCRESNGSHLVLVCHSLAGNEECNVTAYVNESVAAVQCRITDKLQTPFIEVLLPDGKLMRRLDQSASIIAVLDAKDQLGESADVFQNVRSGSSDGVFHRLKRLFRGSCICRRREHHRVSTDSADDRMV